MNKNNISLLSIISIILVMLIAGCNGKAGNNKTQSNNGTTTNEASAPEKTNHQTKDKKNHKNLREKEEENTSPNAIDVSKILQKNQRKKDIFYNADKNYDGKISRKEFIETIRKRYRLVDENRDGKITKDECENTKYFRTKEKEYLILKDYVSIFEKSFYKADIDKDGFVTDKERKMYMKTEK